ncbi:MAG: hypothetical protein H7834_10880 [Magnetococcus sp. YQC-9]
MNSIVPVVFEGSSVQTNNDREICPCEVVIQDEVLRCPRCGGEYLHQQRVRIFSKPQEDGDAVRNDSDPAGGTSTSIQKHAPGSRDSLFIEFSCEFCDKSRYDDTFPETRFYLCVFQRKGLTLINWVAEMPVGTSVGSPIPLCENINHGWF